MVGMDSTGIEKVFMPLMGEFKKFQGKNIFLSCIYMI